MLSVLGEGLIKLTLVSVLYVCTIDSERGPHITFDFTYITYKLCRKKKKTYKLVSEAQNCHDFIENVGIVILASKSISLSTSFIRVYHEKNEI